MQRIIFEYSPLYFLACLAFGIGYAFVLYSARHHWGRTMNRILFTLRAVLATLLLVLLLGPIIRQTENIFEKPSLAVLVDNSRSLKEGTDTLKLLAGLRQTIDELRKQDRDVALGDFSGMTDSIYFVGGHSDIASGLRETSNRYEGRNLAGIVLVSDGIYNNGLSPLYLQLRTPVYTVGVGDTTQRADAVLRSVDYNRIVYQGNKFPLRAEVGVFGLSNQDIRVQVLQQGKVLQQVTKNSGLKGLLEYDFQLDAGQPGIQRLEVRVEPVQRETNLKNNRASAFIEVVEGKKKILLLARSPHPDIKALRNVVEKNPNFELIVHIPGVKEADINLLQPGNVELIIAHQSPDQEGRTTAILSAFLKAKVSALIIVGQKTQLRLLPTVGVPVTFEPTSQRDEVQTVLNPEYRDLGFSDNLNSNISRYPPVEVPFGKFTYPAIAKTILQQRIGSVITERPLLFTLEHDRQKIAVLTGENIWKWRLNEYQETEKTVSFDELFSKLLQYLSTQDDRRKFRCFPLQHEFTSDGPVVIESQVYNDLFEPVFGNTIDLELRDEQGKLTNYRYVTGPGNSRYRIGGLKEGVYRFRAVTEIKSKKEEVRGEFLLTEQNQESQNLTADFALMRKLAENSGGKFYTLATLDRLPSDLSSGQVKSVIHSEESFHPLINLKMVFFVLLLLVSIEWFLRKYMGAY